MAPNLLSTWSLGAPASDGERDRLTRILDEYLLCLERGEPIAPDELLARHPDVAGRLRGYLSGLALFHSAIAGLSWASTGSDSDGATLRGELGDFRLVREIGRGGMGIVYEGVQLSLERRVAIKVLPFSAAIDEKQITRFKNEAQAAAQIDHPHIVPVFAIGQERGIHYFAMQLIGGQSLAGLLEDLRKEAGLAAAAEDRGTTNRAAETLDHVMAVARMGVQAAKALDAAHEIGVVHRDIKPSNLLIDEKGKVWVTDFGVARCKSGANLTETGHLVGTMPYMSPEQASGQAALVDHRTDIYSLGVTLYELATLRHPCEGVPNAVTADEYGRAQWRRPRCWNSAIPIDFENIVLKAMAEGRDDRYATARELAEDLGRFLDGKPIMARPPSLATRLDKWARRHKRPVAAAAGATSLAMLGVVASLVMIAAERAEKDQAYRAATASHERAERNYEQAQTKFRQAREVLDRFGARVNQLLASELPGAEGVRQELLAEMLPYYRAFASESADDPALQADLALAFSKIGDLSDELGQQEEAERAYQDALTTLERLARSSRQQPEHLRSLALCCNNLGQVLQKRGAMDAAREQLQRALAIQQALVDRSPLATDYRADLATTESNLGLLSSQSGDRQESAKRYRAAIAIQESLRKSDPQDAANLNNLAASYNNLSALFMASRPEIARQWVEKALSLQTTLVRNHPTRRRYQSDLALSYNNLGAIHTRMNQPLDAQRCFQDAIAIHQRLVAAAPLVPAYQRDLSVSYNNLGMAQHSASAIAQAEASFGKALGIQQELVDAHPHDVNLLSGLGGIHNNLGLVYKNSGRLSEACASLASAIAAQEVAHQRASDVTSFRESLNKHYYNYAETLRMLDRPDDAAEVVLKRRNLWAGDADRLVRVAEELAATCKLMPAGSLRQKYLDETRGTLEAAMAAGLDRLPDIKTSPFDALLGDLNFAVFTTKPPASNAAHSGRASAVPGLEGSLPPDTVAQ